MRLPHDLVHDAAEEKVVRAAPAGAGHDDEIGPLLLRHVEDGGGRARVDHRDTARAVPIGFEPRGHRVRVALRLAPLLVEDTAREERIAGGRRTVVGANLDVTDGPSGR